MITRQRKPMIERFWDKVFIPPDGGCWIWTAATWGFGYGRISEGGVGSKTWGAHRFSYLIHVGDPGDQLVRHTCDNPACVNPAHLSLGSYQDNMDDKVSRGRCPRGSAAGTAKLTDDQVRSIRSDSRITRLIAKDHGVHRTTVGKIKAGTLWGHITGEGAVCAS